MAVRIITKRIREAPKGNDHGVLEAISEFCWSY